MFDIGWSELVVIAVVALIAIGPKELPGVLRMVGQWMGKARKMAAEFQGQFQEAMREAEMADLKKSFDEVKEAATGFTSNNVMTSLERDAGCLRLVGEKGAQLGKGPAVAAPPLGFAARLCVGALPDTRQVFDCHGSCRGGGACDDVLADDVVLVSLEAPFPSSEAFLELTAPTPAAPCPLAGFPLVMVTPSSVAVTHQADVPAAIGLPIARGRDVGTPQIDAQGLLGSAQGWVGIVGADEQPPAAFVVPHQVGFGVISATPVSPVSAVSRSSTKGAASSTMSLQRTGRA